MPFATAGDGDGPVVDEAPRAIDPRPLHVGEQVDDLAFVDGAGAQQHLAGVAGPRGLVVLLHGPHCPVSRKRGPADGRLAADLRSRGFGVLIVNATPAAADAFAAVPERYGWGPVVLAPDTAGDLARDLGARSTTEAFLLDAARTLVYRGAVDDRVGLGYERAAPRHRWLEDAVAALLDGLRPAVEATTAPGCVLDSAGPPRRAEADAAPGWHGRIARIVQRNCLRCHRDGGPAPFRLATREDVLAQSDMVTWMVKRRAMPPWFAGEGSHAMANDASLSDRDRQALLDWLAADGPEGDPADAPEAPRFPAGWAIGEPDLVLATEPQAVPAEGVVPYRYLRVANPLEEDRWVRGFEIRNSVPGVVHHVLVFVKYPAGHPEAERQRRYKGGLEGFFAAMVPGSNHLRYPSDAGKLLPAGAELIFQVHYTPDGRAHEDRPRLGLLLHDAPPAREVRSQGIHDVRFAIPAGAKRHEVHATWRAPGAGTLRAFMPHMHLRGTAFRYTLERGDGTHELLLDVPHWDFDWQLAYFLRTPVRIEPGDVIHATGWYDNSPDNPSNPDPQATVRFGEQTWQEMMIGYVEWMPE